MDGFQFMTAIRRDPRGIDVATPAAHARVKALKAAGADLIKISQLVQPDVYQALVDAARRENLLSRPVT